MAGWFELSKSSDNQFRFVLKAGNGEIKESLWLVGLNSVRAVIISSGLC